MKLTTIITILALVPDTASTFTFNPRALAQKTRFPSTKSIWKNTRDDLDEAGDKISRQVDKGKDKLNEAVDKGKDKWNDAEDGVSKQMDKGKDKLNEAGDKISEQVDKGKDYLDKKKFLVFDTSNTKKRLSKNWGFVLTEGTVQVAVGMFALLAPSLAISVTVIQQSLLLAMIGAVNVFSSIFVEDGFKVRNALLGGSQLLLGYLLNADPYDFALVATVGVAVGAFVDGGFRALTALRNKDLPDRGWLFTGGVASILGSQLIWKHINQPLAVLGTLLGVKFVSSGVTRIRAGLTGQAIANGSYKGK